MEMLGTYALLLVAGRAAGSIKCSETTVQSELHRVTGLGDLSHASAVFSRDAQIALDRRSLRNRFVVLLNNARARDSHAPRPYSGGSTKR